MAEQDDGNVDELTDQTANCSLSEEHILDSQTLRSSRTKFLTVSERQFVGSIAAPSPRAFEVVCRTALELVASWEREVRFYSHVVGTRARVSNGYARTGSRHTGRL
jgi:hypothetical protein